MILHSQGKYRRPRLLAFSWLQVLHSRLTAQQAIQPQPHRLLLNHAETFFCSNQTFISSKLSKSVLPTDFVMGKLSV
jgi:hypothetical protein